MTYSNKATIRIHVSQEMILNLLIWCSLNTLYINHHLWKPLKYISLWITGVYLRIEYFRKNTKRTNHILMILNEMGGWVQRETMEKKEFWGDRRFSEHLYTNKRNGSGQYVVVMFVNELKDRGKIKILSYNKKSSQNLW